MSKHGIKIALCFGLAGMALFAGNAEALTAQECGALPSNQFLAAIERGTCRVDIQTAAGPDVSFADNGDDGHNGRNGDGDHGGGNRGGGNDGGGGGGNPGGGRSTKP
ncbi:MAG TPA: hypothetical protein VHA35_00780 [Dongiaceae bacterium]|nr:hypothetical protein [Dongiaceae bacterium]